MAGLDKMIIPTFGDSDLRAWLAGQWSEHETNADRLLTVAYASPFFGWHEAGTQKSTLSTLSQIVRIAISADPSADRIFTRWILDGLNSGKVRFRDLPCTWEELLEVYYNLEWGLARCSDPDTWIDDLIENTRRNPDPYLTREFEEGLFGRTLRISMSAEYFRYARIWRADEHRLLRRLTSTDRFSRRMADLTRIRKASLPLSLDQMRAGRLSRCEANPLDEWYEFNDSFRQRWQVMRRNAANVAPHLLRDYLADHGARFLSKPRRSWKVPATRAIHAYRAAVEGHAARILGREDEEICPPVAASLEGLCRASTSFDHISLRSDPEDNQPIDFELDTAPGLYRSLWLFKNGLAESAERAAARLSAEFEAECRFELIELRRELEGPPSPWGLCCAHDKAMTSMTGGIGLPIVKEAVIDFCIDIAAECSGFPDSTRDVLRNLYGRRQIGLADLPEAAALSQTIHHASQEPLSAAEYRSSYEVLKGFARDLPRPPTVAGNKHYRALLCKMQSGTLRLEDFGDPETTGELA